MPSQLMHRDPLDAHHFAPCAPWHTHARVPHAHVPHESLYEALAPSLSPPTRHWGFKEPRLGVHTPLSPDAPPRAQANSR